MAADSWWNFSAITGRNGSDPPLSLAPQECVEAMNVDFYEGGLCRKRLGAVFVGPTGFVDPVGIISALYRHVPTFNELEADLWAVGDLASLEGAFLRMAPTGTWSFVSVPAVQDEIDPGTQISVEFATFNRKLYLAYDSAVNRLHVWAAGYPFIRRAGLLAPTLPPTFLGDTGPAPIEGVRKYAIAWTRQDAGVTLGRSDLGPAGNEIVIDNTTVEMERPADPLVSEGATHWELWAYSSDDNFGLAYPIGTAPLSQLSIVDDHEILTGEGPPLIGEHLPPPSARYLKVMDARLVMAGAFETTGLPGETVPKPNRLWWTPVLGTTDRGDDERIPNVPGVQANYLDFEADVTGLGGPVDGELYVFSYRRLWRLVPTQVVTAAFRRVSVSDVIGSIEHKAIVLAENEAGHPTLYWLSHKGPYRLGQQGIQYCGRDIEDIWARVNLDATTIVGHGVYHAALHQIWWWVATDGANEPTEKIVLDVQRTTTDELGRLRGGWVRGDGGSAKARCSALFGHHLTQTRLLRPIIGSYLTSSEIWQCDRPGVVTDRDVAYGSRILSRPVMPWGFGMNGGMSDDAHIMAVRGPATLFITVNHDFTREVRQISVSLGAEVPGTTPTRVQKRIEGLHAGGLWAFQIEITDIEDPGEDEWVVDAIAVPLRLEGPR